MLVRYRLDDRVVEVGSGSWVPATAELHVSLNAPVEDLARSYRLEVLVREDGERVWVEVPGIQEWEKATRKWIHADISGAQASEGRWIWSGSFRAGDEITLQWRDNDTGRIVPHPVTLRMVESFGAKLAFAMPGAKASLRSPPSPHTKRTPLAPG